MERRVVFLKGRGAIVSDWKQLLKLVPGSLSIPADMAINLQILEFSVVHRQKTPAMVASYWLKKADKRAKEQGTVVPCKMLVQESTITVRDCRRAFRDAIRQADSLRRKKLKKGAGAWSSAVL